MYAGKKFKAIVGIAMLLFLVGFVIGWLVIQQVIVPVSFVLIMSLLMVVMLENRKGVQLQLKEASNDYQQVESLFYLFSSLRVRHPLPPMRGWAISPDFANIVISCIRECKPKLVVEAGSGVSTLVAAYCLQEMGEGTVISFEHDKQYAELSTANVTKHQLQDTATILYAPLKEVAIHGKNWLWYDTEYLRNLGSIDMLIVDGPPAETQKLTRYPALPILFHLLSDDAVVILDDASRSDESMIVKLWLREFAGFQFESVPAEKGAVILRRQTAIRSTLEIKASQFLASNI